MHRMSPQDASFLHIEDDATSMHIGSVSVFEGPAPAYDELHTMIAGKLPLVPRYRQRVRFVPFDVGRPVWVDDPHFNLGYHLRHTALPHPGGDAQLQALVGRVMSQRLDRARPLWEMWIVEGLDDGHWALVTKVHHAMVDGVAGTDLLATLLDRTPEPAAPAPDAWRPEPEPTDARLVADALVERALSPYEQLRGWQAGVRAPRQAVRRGVDTLRGMTAYGRMVAPTGTAGLNGPVTQHRRWLWATSSLADVKTVRSALGGTVNDVVLAMITRGFRDLLIGRGARVEGTTVRTMVPVSVRRTQDRGVYDNRVSAMFAELPVGIPDPAARLTAVHEQMKGLKESRQAVAGETLTSLSDFAPPALLALGTRLAARLPQRNVQTVTTNVPGPQFPLYALGRQLIAPFPYVPLGNNVRIGVAIISYLGRLDFGITGDWDGAPDIDVLARGIEQGAAELLKAAEARRG